MADHHVRGGKNSSRKGIPNKTTHIAIERLKELKCDPLLFSARVMAGKELTHNHPAAKDMIRLIQEIEKYVDRDDFDKEILKQRTLAMKKYIADVLINSTTPIEIRSKHALELLKYVAPQLKSVDVTAHIRDGSIHLHFDKQDEEA